MIGMLTLAASIGLGLMTIGQDSQPSDPIAAKLTVRANGGVGSFEPPAKLLLVEVEGAALEPGRVGLLVTDPGDHAVPVDALNEPSCAGQALLQTGTGTTVWCLKISNVRAGHTYTGVIKPPAGGETDVPRTALTLTLTSRHHFFGLPFVVVAVALALAYLWSRWVSKGLAAFVSANRLHRAMQQNRGDDGRLLLIGLDAWAKNLIDRKKKTVVEVHELVLDALHYAKENGTKAREKLRDKVTGFPKSNPSLGEIRLLKDARELMARGDTIADLYTDEGTAVSPHPAAAATTRLDTVHRIWSRLQVARENLHKRRPRRSDLERQADEVEKLLRQAADDRDLTEAEVHLGRVLDDLHLAASPEELEEPVPAQERMVASPTPHPTLRQGIVLRVLGRLAAAAANLRLPLVIMGTVIGFIVIAGVTVLSSNYSANHTFGTAWDYLGLFLAAFGSASVAGIVSAFAFDAAAKR